MGGWSGHDLGQDVWVRFLTWAVVSVTWAVGNRAQFEPSAVLSDQSASIGPTAVVNSRPYRRS